MLCPVLVGREEHMQALGHGLEAALTGAGGVVVLLGEAGLGKSRLAREFASEARSRHCTVLSGRALPGSGSAALRAFADALQPAFRTRRPPDGEEIRPFVAALARLVPEWRSEEGVAGPSDPVLVGEGVVRLLRLLAGPTASVLILEDLQWGDAETLAVVEYLADHLSIEPVLCMLTCRSDERSAGSSAIQTLIDRRVAVAVRLARLNQADELAMARACLASAELAPGLPELVSRADGNPFLVEELLASAVTSGALSREGETWRLDPTARGLLPITFAESVRRRVAGLGPDGRRVLQVGAVLGRSFDWTLLGPVLGLADERVVAVLRGAQDCQLIERDGSSAEAVFRFRHALTREAILGELLPHELAPLAARTLEVVRAFRPDLPGEWCTAAIRLAETAGLDDRATELLIQAAARAEAEGALATAEAILGQADERVKAGSPSLRADVESALLEVLAQAGNTDRAVQVAERLLLLLDQLGAGDTRRASVHLNLARALVAASRWEDAGQHLETARHIVTSRAGVGVGVGVGVGENQIFAAIGALAAEVAMGQQQLVEARERAVAALELAEASDQPQIACQALEVLGRAARVHDLDGAERYFSAAVQLAERHRLAVRRVRALHELGTIGMLRSHDLTYLDQASQLALETGALSTCAVVNLQLGSVYVYGLEHEAALECARRAADIAAHLGLGLTEAAATAMQATAHALAGRREDVERTVAEALSLADGHPDIAVQLWGNARGMGALLHEQRAPAVAALDEAMTFLRDPRCTVPGGIIGPLWALLHTLVHQNGATEREEVRASRAAAIPIGRALLGYADAVALARAAQPMAAMTCFEEADSLVRGYQHLGVRLLGVRLVAEAAIDQGWGEPVAWLREALVFFEDGGYYAVAAACRKLLVRAGAPLPRRGRGDSTVPQALRARGVTSREVDVLALVMHGLTNRQIGERLYLSPKTVEKHVERLMSKMRAASRVELAASARAAGVAVDATS
jgi:DNA-binding CsgD family transcriptional regulator/tetratricopeptide (TPR) repeat protein